VCVCMRECGRVGVSCVCAEPSFMIGYLYAVSLTHHHHFPHLIFTQRNNSNT
jgi:hypothetical protein